MRHRDIPNESSNQVNLLFSYKKNVPADPPSVKSTQGTHTEFVASYKYLGILSNEKSVSVL